MSKVRAIDSDSYQTYEEHLREDPWSAVHEGGMHFGGKSQVQETLRRLASKLDELGIPYAVVGALALNFHGYLRFTEDVDIVITRKGLLDVHKHLIGMGYRPLFHGSKNLRDTENGVRVEFIITGEYPGDGKPKPVSFPDPEQASTNIRGLSVVNLPTLLELKLASGISNPARAKDLGDAQELIKYLELPFDFGDQLNEYVREKYKELWQGAQFPDPEANA